MAEQELHIMFFPYMAAGHIIPVIEMAKLFVSCDVKITIVMTPAFASMIPESLKDSVSLQIIEFPPTEAGLPPGCDSIDKVLEIPELFPKFTKAVEMMQPPLEKMLQELAPHCLVADMFFPWATAAAAKFGIPRIVFHGYNLFTLCASKVLKREKPFRKVSSDSESFLIPDLPHEIPFTRLKLLGKGEIVSDITRLMHEVWESEATCHGVIVNSFLALEPEYAEYYKKVLGRKAWQIGPLPLFSSERKEIAASVDNKDECLRWLDGKKPNSVIYFCFGSMAELTTTQLHEIAFSLESSGHQFIWVIRTDGAQCLPEGFEERTLEANRGLIVKGWAPQVLILEHEAIGAFVTHCGWNSMLEAICAGVPMVTWPLFAEQFYNEMFATKVLGVGVSVGSTTWNRVGSGVSRESITNALKCIMEGDEAIEMRNKANELKEMARQAVQEAGSSYNDLTAFLKEMSQVSN